LRRARRERGMHAIDTMVVVMATAMQQVSCKQLATL
jgi:hypothetical protein